MGPYGRFLSNLLGFLFVRLILVGAVLVAMAAFWQGYLLPALGMVVAVAYFLYLYWQYVQVDDAPEP